MNTLIIINFETGDSSCRYYEVPIIVKKSMTLRDIDSIKDGMMSYFDSNDEDEDYDDSVKNVMDASGIIWERFTYGKGMQIDTFYELYV